jgi:hypothetical protein
MHPASAGWPRTAAAPAGILRPSRRSMTQRARAGRHPAPSAIHGMAGQARDPLRRTVHITEVNREGCSDSCEASAWNDPAVFLKPGNVVRCDIDDIGSIQNRIAGTSPGRLEPVAAGHMPDRTRKEHRGCEPTGRNWAALSDCQSRRRPVADGLGGGQRLHTLGGRLRARLPQECRQFGRNNDARDLSDRRQDAIRAGELKGAMPILAARKFVLARLSRGPRNAPWQAPMALRSSIRPRSPTSPPNRNSPA